MTYITLELEERHKRLCLETNSLSTEANSNARARQTESMTADSANYCKNFGYYNSTRYASRLISLAVGAQLADKVALSGIYSAYSAVTLGLLFFIFFYFKELKVVHLYKKLPDQTPKPPFLGLLCKTVWQSLTHKKHWPLQLYALLTCLVPTSGLETFFATAFLQDNKMTVTPWNMFVAYACGGVFILIVVQYVLCVVSNKTKKLIFLSTFFLTTVGASVLVLLATWIETDQQLLFFAAIVTMNLANAVILIVLVTSFHETQATVATSFSINLMSSLFSLSLMGARILLEAENHLAGQAAEDLDFSRFRVPAAANLAITLMISPLLVFKVKV